MNNQSANPNPPVLREDFASLARLLTALLAFAALSQVAEAYVPIKHLLVDIAERAGPSPAQEQLVAQVPALLLLGALWQGRKLFQHLEGGALLAPLTGHYVRRCGEWMVAAGGSALIIGEIQNGTAAGSALLVSLAAIGFALRSLAGVLDHAAAMQADLDQIV